MVFVEFPAHTNIAEIHALQAQATARIKGLREDLMQQLTDLLGV
jgi:hypothetical protein